MHGGNFPLAFRRTCDYEIIDDYPVMGDYLRILTDSGIEGPYAVRPPNERFPDGQYYTRDLTSVSWDVPYPVPPIDEVRLIAYQSTVNPYEGFGRTMALYTDPGSVVDAVNAAGREILTRLREDRGLVELSVKEKGAFTEEQHVASAEDYSLEYHIVHGAKATLDLRAFGERKVVERIFENAHTVLIDEALPRPVWGWPFRHVLTRDGLAYDLSLKGKGIEDAVREPNILI